MSRPITKAWLAARVATSLAFTGAMAGLVAIGTGSEVFKSYAQAHLLRALFLTGALLSAGGFGYSWGEYKWQAASFATISDADKAPRASSAFNRSRRRSWIAFALGYVLLILTVGVMIAAAWISVTAPEMPQPIRVVTDAP